eukprot:3416221-Rhodomonas_salina.5
MREILERLPKGRVSHPNFGLPRSKSLFLSHLPGYLGALLCSEAVTKWNDTTCRRSPRRTTAGVKQQGCLRQTLGTARTRLGKT